MAAIQNTCSQTADILHRFTARFVPVNLSQLQWWIDTGRIDPTQKITMKTMRDAGLISKLTKSYEHGVKLLGDVRASSPS